MPSNVDPIALREAKKILVEVATNQNLTTYQQFTSKLNNQQPTHFEPHSPQLWDILKELAEESYNEYQHMLPVLVTLGKGENQGWPGHGFFTLAESLGLGTDKNKIYSEQIEKVYTFYKNKKITESLVSVEIVAKHLNITEDSIYRWIKSKDLPAYRMGKLWKFKLSEIETWMQARKINNK